MAACLTLMAGSSSESGSAGPTKEHNKAEITRIASGTYTQGHLTLIKSQLKLARQVPDPTRPEVVATKGSALSTYGERYAIRCGAWRWQT